MDEFEAHQLKREERIKRGDIAEGGIQTLFWKYIDQKIRRNIVSLNEKLISGQCKDFGEYQSISGQIRGLKQALNMPDFFIARKIKDIKEIENEKESEDNAGS